MIPLQNFNHRSSASMLFRQYESRKHSPITHVVITQRRSQQFDGRSISPSKVPLQPYPKLIQAYEIKQRIPTQGQTIPISEALKIYSTKQTPDSKKQTNKLASSYNQGIPMTNSYNYQEKSNCTKTTTGDEEDKYIKLKQASQNILFQKQLLDKDLQIMTLQKEIKQLKEQQKKFLILERDHEKIIQENQKLKIQLQHQYSLTSPGRPSEYVSALSEQDKQKIKTLLEID